MRASGAYIGAAVVLFATALMLPLGADATRSASAAACSPEVHHDVLPVWMRGAATRAHQDAYNASRREGPFPTVCCDCGVTFDAVRRTIQVRCPACTRKRRSERPGPSTRTRLKGES